MALGVNVSGGVVSVGDATLDVAASQDVRAVLSQIANAAAALDTMAHDSAKVPQHQPCIV